MLRTVGGGTPTLWESILPSAVLGMPGELERVDRLLEDRRSLCGEVSDSITQAAKSAGFLATHRGGRAW